MANVTVTIEGDVNEVVAMLRGMAGRVSGASQLTVAGEGAVGSSPAEAMVGAAAMEAGVDFQSPTVPQPLSTEAVWTTSYVSTFWRNLSDTARQAMLRVSRSPNHSQKRAQLMHTLRLSQRELSGSLSSQGHSLNRLKRRRGNVDLPRPLIYDRTEDAYVLDPHFADALRELGMT